MGHNGNNYLRVLPIVCSHKASDTQRGIVDRELGLDAHWGICGTGKTTLSTSQLTLKALQGSSKVHSELTIHENINKSLLDRETRTPLVFAEVLHRLPGLTVAGCQDTKPCVSHEPRHTPGCTTERLPSNLSIKVHKQYPNISSILAFHLRFHQNQQVCGMLFLTLKKNTS